jgi:hypothetical protein
MKKRTSVMTQKTMRTVEAETDIAATTFAAEGARVGMGLKAW